MKKVSQGFEIADEENKEPPTDKVTNIFRLLEKLKNSSIDSHFQEQRELEGLEGEMLKEVYDKKVQEMLRKPTNTSRLKQIFDGFDFELVNAYPLPIIILILEYDDAKKAVQKKFEKFLRSKKI